MTEQLNTMAAEHAVILLKSYSFDLEGFKAEELVAEWLEFYKGRWIRSAVVEALYQGRYKAVSVKQLLVFWQRRGEPICHFNHEFEHIVCDSFIQTSLTAPINPPSSSTSESAAGAVSSQEINLPSVEDSEVAVMESHPNSQEQPTQSVSAAASKTRDLSLPTLGVVPLALPSSSQIKPKPSEIRSVPNGSDSPSSDRPPDNSTQDPPPSRDEQSDHLPTDSQDPIAELLDPQSDLDRLAEDLFLLGSESPEEDVPPASSIHNPIHQFVPVEDPSEFYDKLKAVALASQSEL